MSEAMLIFTRKPQIQVEIQTDGDHEGRCSLWNLITMQKVWTVGFDKGVMSVSLEIDRVYQERMLAWSMGMHRRLGESSRVLSLGEDLLRMVVDPDHYN